MIEIVDIMEMIGARQPPPMDPETAKRHQEFAQKMHAAELAFEVEQRELLVANAWLFCRCRKRFTWNKRAEPPQARCPVHGTFMMTPEGRLL